MAKSDSCAGLELPVVKVQPRLLGGSTPAETITNAATGKEPGLFCWGKLKPKFLGMNFINGVGKLAL